MCICCPGSGSKYKEEDTDEEEPSGSCVCCSRETKYQFAVGSRWMVTINSILFVILLLIGAVGISEVFGITDSGYEALKTVNVGIISAFSLVAAVMFFVIIPFQILTVCCYKSCCCLLALQVPLTLIFGVALAAAAALIGKYDG